MKTDQFTLVSAMAAALVALSAAAPASASVLTSGCAGAASCTLAELYGGGSITINDVSFNGFTFNFGNGLALDDEAITVAGVDETTPGVVGLTFMFDPAVAVAFDDFLEYDWNFDASINAGVREIVEAFLGIDASDSFGDAFVEVASELSDGAMSLLRVDEGGVFPSTDTVSFLTALTTLSFGFDIVGEAFEEDAFAEVSQFRLLLTLKGEPPVGEVPLPAAFPLMLAGLAGLGALTRRRRPNRA